MLHHCKYIAILPAAKAEAALLWCWASVFVQLPARSKVDGVHLILGALVDREIIRAKEALLPNRNTNESWRHRGSGGAETLSGKLNHVGTDLAP